MQPACDYWAPGDHYITELKACCLFNPSGLCCLSIGLMSIVRATLGEQTQLMDLIMLQHTQPRKRRRKLFFFFFFSPLLTLGVCLCVDVCTSVGERSAVCGSTGTPRGPIRRRQIKLHLFWSWCRRWRGPERKPRPPAALQLFTAGVKVACLLCLLWKNDFFFFFHRPILGCLISPGRVSH